eukprot:Gb_09956 [translate_table: standard]
MPQLAFGFQDQLIRYKKKLHSFADHQSREKLEAKLQRDTRKDVGTLCNEGRLKEALNVLYLMGKVDSNTYVSILQTCVNMKAIAEGKRVHTHIVKTGFEPDLSVGNKLVIMYAKCKNHVSARQVFDEMPERDMITWTAMIGGYSQNGHGKDALKLFSQMLVFGMKPNQYTFGSVLSACSKLEILEEGNNPNQATFPSVLSACANLAALGKGKHIHAYIIKSHGRGKEAVELFEQMQNKGMKPNDVTFLCVLSACNHAGLVDEGFCYFNSICRDHCIEPRAEHYSCMVDLLGRSGRLVEAINFIKKMPFEADAGLWRALLGACRIHGNTELGQYAAERLFELQAAHTSTYVLLSNIYAEAGRWDDVAKVRIMMKDKGVKKTPGCSWIEVKNRVHSFVIGDQTHSQTEEIYAMLEKLSGQMKEAGQGLSSSLVSWSAFTWEGVLKLHSASNACYFEELKSHSCHMADCQALLLNILSIFSTRNLGFIMQGTLISIFGSVPPKFLIPTFMEEAFSNPSQTH